MGILTNQVGINGKTAPVAHNLNPDQGPAMLTMIPHGFPPGKWWHSFINLATITFISVHHAHNHPVYKFIQCYTNNICN
jgi:hypothetical protein